MAPFGRQQSSISRRGHPTSPLALRITETRLFWPSLEKTAELPRRPMNTSRSSGTRALNLESAIERVAGLDLLRVLREAEQVSAKLPGATGPEKAPVSQTRGQVRRIQTRGLPDAGSDRASYFESTMFRSDPDNPQCFGLTPTTPRQPRWPLWPRRSSINCEPGWVNQ